MFLELVGIALGTILAAVLANTWRDRVASKNGNGYEHLDRCRRE